VHDTYFNSTQFAVYNGVSYDYKNATIMKLLDVQWWWRVTVTTFILIVVVIINDYNATIIVRFITCTG